MVVSRASSRRSTSTRSPSRWQPSPNPSWPIDPVGDPVDDLTFEELPPPPPPPPPEALAGTGLGEGLPNLEPATSVLPAFGSDAPTDDPSSLGINATRRRCR